MSEMSKHNLLFHAMYSLTIEQFCKEIIKWLHDDFEEFKDLSKLNNQIHISIVVGALKITKLLHKSTNEAIPSIGVIKDYIAQEEEIICEVKSLDIWLNMHIDFESNQKWMQSFLKIKVEN